MIDLKRRNLTMEDALEAFKSESKPVLAEYARHAHFTPDRQKRRPAMHKKSKTNKGRRR